MATIRNRGPYQWQAVIRRRGYPKQLRTFELKADAEAWARSIENEMDRGIFVSRAEAERTTLREALDRYEEEVSRAKRGRKEEHYKLDYFRRTDLAAYFLSNIRSGDIARWRDEFLKDHAPGTCVRMLALLRHVFEAARRDWGMEGLKNPVSLVRKPSLVGASRSRRLQPGEEEELLKRARQYGGSIGSIVILALETAMRRGEIASLRWDQVDLRRRIIFLPQTKNGESREVPLSSRARDTLLQLPRRIDGDVFGIRGDGITQAFGRICGSSEAVKNKAEKRKELKEMKDLRFHDLRHEATSRLFERGLNHFQVAAITGHKTMQMLKRYTHLRADDLVALLG